MSGTRYDLIYFTALREECYFLVRHLLAKNRLCSRGQIENLKPDPLFGSDSSLKMIEIDGQRIGVVTTAEMGGVRSAVKITQICENLLPRCVIVVGLCGAYRSDKIQPNLGDIYVAEQYGYHSYGKIVGSNKIFEMRDLSNVLPSFSPTLLQQIISETTWKKQAKTWQHQSSISDWLCWSHKAGEHSYANQCAVMNAEASLATFLSGEVVVASNNYVDTIVKDKMLNRKSVAFDMESYSIAYVCKQYNIPCLTIKGVSDFADDPTEDRAKSLSQPAECNVPTQAGKSDNFRFAAIAAASAFAVTCDRSRIMSSNMAEIKKPTGDSIENCLMPQAHIICPYNHSSTGLRKCIQLDEEVTSGLGTVTWLSRVFDDVRPNNYSDCLENLSKIVKNGGFVTVFFPYSAESIINLLISELSIKEGINSCISNDEFKFFRKILGEYVHGDKDDIHKKQDIKKIILKLNNTARDLDLFSHFKTWDTYCLNNLKINQQKCRRPSFCRIIVFENNSLIRCFNSNVLNLAYPALLGKTMMTFGVSANFLRQKEAAVADVVFAENDPFEDNNIKQHKENCEYPNFVAMRFFLDARTLVFTGTQCDEFKLNGRNRRMSYAKSIKNLYTVWDKFCDDATKFIPLDFSDICREFN